MATYPWFEGNEKDDEHWKQWRQAQLEAKAEAEMAGFGLPNSLV